MSLRVPLAVVLRVDGQERHVTADVRDLTFGWVDPGGYASCRIDLDRPLSTQPREIGYYGDMTVYDTRSGAKVWEGRQEDPGRSAGDGEVWRVVAIGGRAHARDRTVPLTYVTTSLQAWGRVDNVTAGGQDSVTTDPGDATGVRQALVLRIPQGTTVAADSRVVSRNSEFAKAGMKIARVAFAWDAGITSGSLLVQAIMSTTGLGTADTIYSTALSTAGGSTAEVITTDWSAANGRNQVDVRFYNVTVTGGVSADTWWLSLRDIAVRAVLVDRSGVEITTAASYTTSTVLAHEVVADLLGRLLTQYDGPNAVISTTGTHPIDHLSYPDGVAPERVLADLMALETGHTWRVWGRTASGRWQYEWTEVPTAVRYEVGAEHYESEGSADGLYNAVTVRWRDAAGQIQTTTVAGTSPILSDANITRQGLIDLGDEVGSASDAARAGQEWLAERAYPANAGRVRISEPILDLQTGRMVQPWEIRPGLIRVRGILPRIDALNRTARDGVTVFRIVGCEYRASSNSATLDLDSRPASVPNLLAEALSRPVVRRR
jgi:hypothetical protein